MRRSISSSRLVGSRLLGVLGVALILGVSATPRAAMATGTLEQAKAWFQEGEKAEERGDCGTAIQKFKLALGVKETPQLHLRIGRCQEKLGKLKDAYDAYVTARKLAAGNDKIAGVADQQLTALEPKLPRLSLVVKNPPPGLEVRVDGAPVTSFVEDRYENPGEVRVTARAEGYLPFEAKMNLEAGDKRSLDVVLVAARKDEPLRAAPVEVEAGGPHPASWVLIGLGAAGIGAGIGLVVHGFQLQSDLENPSTYACTLVGGVYRCKADPATGKDMTFGGKSPTDVQRQSNVFKGAGGAVLGVGGAAAIAGAVLAIATRHSSQAATSSSVSITPILGPTLSGVAVGGRF